MASAYQRLVCLQSQEQREVFEEKMFSRLRAQLQPKEVRTQHMAERRKRIHEMVRQLRDQQYLSRVREQHGVSHESQMAVAKALHHYLGGGGVMEGWGGTVAECQQNLASLPIPDKVRRAMPLLFNELTEEVVQAALERMKRGSAPGMDGIPAELYQAYPEVFVPRLLEIMQLFLKRAGGGGPGLLGDVFAEMPAQICRRGMAKGLAPHCTSKRLPQMDFHHDPVTSY